MGGTHAKEQDLRALAAAQEHTHFTLAEVRHLRAHFQAIHGEAGGLTRDEFAVLLDDLDTQGLTASSELVNVLFTLCDVDSSGSVEFKELLMALSICARGDASEKLELTFRLFGHGNDASLISRASLLAALTALRPLFSPSADDDAEAAAASSSSPSGGLEDDLEGYVDAIFAECDLDEDGSLNRDEFARAVAARPSLLGFLDKIVSPDTAPDRARRYLVAVDAGQSCSRAFDHVLADIRGTSHALTLISVVRKIDMRHKPPLMDAAAFTAEFDAKNAAMLALMETYAQRARDAGVASVSTQHIKDVQNPGVAIINACDESDIDVLVMGFEGEAGRRSQSAEVHLGDVAQYCINHSPCSVLIVK